MLGKNYYHRSFIILQARDKGYGSEEGKEPAGYCKFEIKKDRGKAYIYVQDIKEPDALNGIYEVILVPIKGEELSQSLGILNIDKRGRAESIIDFNPLDVGGSGRSIEEFHAIAIALVNQDSPGDISVKFPLVGYANRRIDIDWTGRVAEAIKSRILSRESNTQIKNISEKEISPAELDVEIAKEYQHEQNKQIYEDEELDMEIAKDITREETVMEEQSTEEAVVGEEATKEFAVKQQQTVTEETATEGVDIEEPGMEEGVIEEGVVEKQVIVEGPGEEATIEQVMAVEGIDGIEEIMEETHVRGKDVENASTEERKREGIEGLADEGNVEKLDMYEYEEEKESKVQKPNGDLIESIQVEDVDERERFEAEEQMQVAQTLDFAIDDLSYMEDLTYDGDTTYTDDLTYDGDMACRGDLTYEEGMARDLSGEEPIYWSKVKDYFHGLIDNHGLIDPFDDWIEEAMWIRVSQFGMHYTYPYNDHYIVGLIRKNGRMKYIIYGIPGPYGATPPHDMEGFYCWKPAKGMYGFGYWLLYIDANTGEVICPY